MINIKEAKRILSANTGTLPERLCSVRESLGLILSEGVLSPMDVPSFDNSAMDGYAIPFQKGRSKYRVAGEIQAGEYSERIFENGESVRIFTGAPIPEGVDTVIRQEVVTVEGDYMYYDPEVSFKGSNVRKTGEQCSRGDLLVRQGTLVTPGVVALLSSVGIDQVKAIKAPGVKVLITGNELTEPGSPLRSGSIYNSNQTSITAYFNHIGISQVDSEKVEDDYVSLARKVGEALEKYDLLILSGGISVGEYDFSYRALIDSEVEPLFYRVRQKPGKPLFAGKKGQKLVFGLPGNPAAVLSCFNQYVKPAVWQMMGRENTFQPSGILPLAHDYGKRTPLANVLKAKVNGGEVRIMDGQESFNLRSFSEANAFVLLYDEDAMKCAGDLVEVYNW